MAFTYEEALNYIYELPKFTAKHSFEEGREFLDRLGAPDTGMKVIHVAGTNGKGSVCAYMESILMHAGMSTGCFVSPHLNDCRERIRISGRMCGHDEFISAFEKVHELSEELYVPTFFEYMFFVAMLIFKTHEPDIVILETGLGGRLDATNIVRDKLISVITSIGYDHCQYLGDTYEEIAREKAGIIASGRPVIYWEDICGRSSISETAVLRSSVEIALSKDLISNVHRDNSGIDFCLRYKYDSFICLNVETCAFYQVKNAGLAVMSLMSVPEIRSFITDDDIVCGVRDTIWPGRMEEIVPGVFLDGAHNEPAIKALIESIRFSGDKHAMLVFGCMRDKDYKTEIGLLVSCGLFDRAVCVSVNLARSENAAVIAQEFTHAGADDVSVAADAQSAFDIACGYVKETGFNAYIIGSLYLIGEIRGLM
ncbi:MAG: bifunctional folylpolyglutamate synthase/dihydrofolate synthase [Lachnospiraceae bacterium]|nr:bifunctional folylpolyglutamate synthase/dihydrofolate synthase [Lachnospiraceae bacterium]